MAEYISREGAVDEFEQCNAKNPQWTPQRVKTLLLRIPAADVAPVVRCKDCKHYDIGVCLKIYSDGNVHPEAWQSRRPDDLCSYGERKDGGNAGR
nr:MAG TPA: hypothetical protein [Caudoviricetes sp.]